MERRIRARIEAACARLGVSYPWWIPAYSALACVALTGVAYGQRGRPFDPVVLTAAVICGLPLVMWTFSRWLFPPWAESMAATVGVAMFLVHPVTPDFAPLLLMILAGEVAATSLTWVALASATVNIAALVWAAEAGHLANASIYVVGVILGADVGIALRWQMRALAAERAHTSIVSEQATLAERQRLAREVHDVVGHALSVTMLHVTAARHSLQQYGDTADALESLVEAERSGRSAMGDLRRTVAVLGAGPTGTQPLPGLADVPALIERSRLAGLDVCLDRDAPLHGVADTAGLGLYRIVQESLANIAKHAPTASARVRLEARGEALRLSVCNTLPDGPPGTPVGGTGLRGMAARAEQIGADLRAGMVGDHWLVEVTLPVGAVAVSR